MNLKLAFVIKGLLALSAFRFPFRFGPWRVLENGFHHGAVLEIFGDVALVITQDIWHGLNDLVLFILDALGDWCWGGSEGNFIFGAEQDVLAIWWHIEEASGGWGHDLESTGALDLISSELNFGTYCWWLDRRLGFR